MSFDENQEFAEYCKIEYAVWKGPEMPYDEWLDEHRHIMAIRFDAYRKWFAEKFYQDAGDTSCTDNGDTPEKLPLCLF